MRNFSILLLVVSLTSGCAFTSAPNQNLPYSNVTTIEDLAGCYKNQGEREEGIDVIFLSQIIFPEYSPAHFDIEVVSVLVESESILYVAGKKDGSMLFEKRFTKDRDFTLNSGTITIKSQFLGHLLYPQGSPAIGVEYNSVTLGLDVSGDGKSTESSAFAGTMFVFIPTILKVTETTRFKRIGRSC